MVEVLDENPYRIRGDEVLWECWKVSRDPNLRCQLFEFYAPWSRRLASAVYAKYRYPLAEWRDYVHFASVGLLQALDAFDQSAGVVFETFAGYRVKGAILNGLHGLNAEGLSFQRKLRSDGRCVIERTGDSASDLAQVAVGLAFGYFLESGISEFRNGNDNPYAALAQQSDITRICALLPCLTKNERFVIECHYFQQLSFAAIAALLDVSKPRITQLHQQALVKLKALFSEVKR